LFFNNPDVTGISEEVVLELGRLYISLPNSLTYRTTLYERVGGMKIWRSYFSEVKRGYKPFAVVEEREDSRVILLVTSPSCTTHLIAST